MKQLTFAAFIAFWSSAGTLFALSLLVPAVSTGLPAAPAVTYSLSEVARHNTLADCWMAIKGQVYDFSDYIPKHPAPPVAMAAWCGKDATEGMNTKGYGNSHSRTAWEMMEAYWIGVLVQQ